MIRARLSAAVALGAMVLVSACGSDETAGPAPSASNTPTPSPTPSPSPTTSTIPPRTQTTTYAPGFTPDQDRALEGFQITIINTQTGASLPGGGAVIDSAVALSERGPRSSDSERFTGSVTYTLGTRRAVYVDGANNTSPFTGEAASFTSREGAVEWTANSLSLPAGDSSLIWRQTDPFNLGTSAFYSLLMLENRQSDRVTRSMFFGGSITDANDLPPSGVESQRTRIVLQSDEPGDGSYELAGEGDLRIDYFTGNVSGTIALLPTQGSRAQPLNLVIDGSIDAGRRWVRADLSGGGSGRFAGAFFGPYGGEIAATVRFERGNGQSFYGRLEARRR